MPSLVHFVITNRDVRDHLFGESDIIQLFTEELQQRQHNCTSSLSEHGKFVSYNLLYVFTKVQF